MDDGLELRSESFSADPVKKAVEPTQRCVCRQNIF